MAARKIQPVATDKVTKKKVKEKSTAVKSTAKKLTSKVPNEKKTTVKKPAEKKTTAKASGPKTPRAKTVKVDFKGLTPKQIATANGEPWVNVLNVELDPDNIGNGAFELDFNDIFIARLHKAGYTGKDDYEIVDRWFNDICKNILAENYEQWEANQPVDARPRVIDRKDIGDGRTEVS